jgi:hypothetical protein
VERPHHLSVFITTLEPKVAKPSNIIVSGRCRKQANNTLWKYVSTFSSRVIGILLLIKKIKPHTGNESANGTNSHGGVCEHIPVSFPMGNNNNNNKQKWSSIPCHDGCTSEIIIIIWNDTSWQRS